MTITNKKDFISATVILAVVAFLYSASYSIDLGLNYALGPVFFPRLMLGLVGVAAVVLALQSLGKRSEEKAAHAGSSLDRQTVMYRCSLVGLTLLYILVIPMLSYVAATIIFLILGMMLLGDRTPKKIALYAVLSVAITFGLEYIFSGLLHLFLP